MEEKRTQGQAALAAAAAGPAAQDVAKGAPQGAAEQEQSGAQAQKKPARRRQAELDYGR